MCDEPDNKPLLETIGDGIRDCLPERLRDDERFAHGLGSVCGLAAGWVVGKTVIKWFFGKGDEK